MIDVFSEKKEQGFAAFIYFMVTLLWASGH